MKSLADLNLSLEYVRTLHFWYLCKKKQTTVKIIRNKHQCAFIKFNENENAWNVEKKNVISINLYWAALQK